MTGWFFGWNIYYIYPKKSPSHVGKCRSIFTWSIWVSPSMDCFRNVQENPIVFVEKSMVSRCQIFPTKPIHWNVWNIPFILAISLALYQPTAFVGYPICCDDSIVDQLEVVDMSLLLCLHCMFPWSHHFPPQKNQYFSQVKNVPL